MKYIAFFLAYLSLGCFGFEASAQVYYYGETKPVSYSYTKGSNSEGGVITKKNDAGNVIWERELFDRNNGNSTQNLIFSLVVDVNNNVFIGGQFTSNIDFDPGPGIENISPGNKVGWYFLKLDRNGRFVWVKTLLINQYKTFNLNTDKAGNLFIYGGFSKFLDFDPGVDDFSLSTNDNQQDGFILKLDPNGAFDWVRHVDGSSYCNVAELTFDNFGNILLSGNFKSNVDLNPDKSAVHILNSKSSLAAFIAKWNASGNFVWAKSFGGDQPIYAANMAVDAQNNIFAGGTYIQGELDLNPGSGKFVVVGKGQSDIFIQKFTSNGNFLWGKSIGGFFEEALYDLKTDKAGNLFTMGSFEAEIDFDPGNRGSLYRAKSGFLEFDFNRNFLLKYTPNGNLTWVKLLNEDLDIRHLFLSLPDENTLITGALKIPNKDCFDNLTFEKLIVKDIAHMKSAESIELTNISIENAKELNIISKEVTLATDLEIDKNSNVLIKASNGCN